MIKRLNAKQLKKRKAEVQQAFIEAQRNVFRLEGALGLIEGLIEECEGKNEESGATHNEK